MVLTVTASGAGQWGTATHSGGMPDWTVMEWLEALSYFATIVGIPIAIMVFAFEQRRDRLNDEEELYQRLSDEYAEFLKLVLDNADLQMLRRGQAQREFTEEEQERRLVLFELLVSLFERAYILVYEVPMPRQQARLWQSWEDYMREWCRRPEFRALLERLLEGEDPDFAAHIRAIAKVEAQR